MEKHFISANDLLKDSFSLAAKVYASGFRPEFMIGVWRGGSPIAIAVNEFFEYMRIPSDHIAIRAISYTGIGQQDKEIKLDGFDYIQQQLDPEKPILIVDDVFDSGRSIEAIINQIENFFGPELKERIKVAVPWYKPANNQTSLTPDYFLHQTDKWLVFPHELQGLSTDEISENKDINDSVFQLILDKHGS